MDKKATKRDAQYQRMASDEDRCAVCANFRPPASCTRVEGRISPQGWCRLFEPAERAARPAMMEPMAGGY
jgi:hypothetical protein